MPITNYIYNREYLEDLTINFDSPEDAYEADARDYADATGDYDLSRYSVGGIRL